MVKEDFIKKLQDSGLTRDEAQEWLQNIVEGVIDILSKEDKLMISRFGSFVVHHKSERTGRDPRSGKTYPIEPQNSVSFIPSRQFRKELNPELDSNK